MRAERRQQARASRRLQARRHLRRRVRGLHALLLLDLRGRSDEARDRHDAARDRHPRRRAQPHRAGHRVRLLLRARGLRAARAGLRDHHGQLQPRDGLDRLRHVRPAVLRAAHARGRAEHLPDGEARRRHRPVRRADAAEPRRGAGGGRRARSSARRRAPSTSPRTASASRNSLEKLGPAPAATTASPPTATRPSPPRAGRLSRCWCARATCSAAAPWRSSTTEDDLRRYIAHGRRGIARAADPVDKFLDDAIEVDVDAVARRRDDRRRRRHGAHRGGGHPLRRLGLRAPAVLPLAGASSTRSSARRTRARRGAGRARPDERPVRRQGRRASTCWRSTRAPRAPCRSSRKATGVPLAKLAAKVMAGKTLAELGVTREIGPAAHRASRSRSSRSASFPGVDIILGPEMRSTGEVMGIDERLRHGLRQEPDRRRAGAAHRRGPCSSACATPTSPMSSRSRAPGVARLQAPLHARHRRVPRRAAVEVEASPRSRRDCAPTSSTA